MMRNALIMLYVVGALGTSSAAIHMDRLRGSCDNWPLRYIIHGAIWPITLTVFTAMFLADMRIYAYSERCKDRG